MTRQRAFTTAAARRRANPIEWIIDEKVIRLRPSVKIDEIGLLVDELNKPQPEGVSDMTFASQKRAIMLGFIREFVEESSHTAFDAIADDIDPEMLSTMIEELVKEYTGSPDPTVAPSSSDGSLTTGISSTAGAQVEA